MTCRTSDLIYAFAKTHFNFVIVLHKSNSTAVARVAVTTTTTTISHFIQTRNNVGLNEHVHLYLCAVNSSNDSILKKSTHSECITIFTDYGCQTTTHSNVRAYGKCTHTNTQTHTEKNRDCPLKKCRHIL